MKRAVAGFTLIELLIVMVIIGVLAAIAVPSYLEHTRKTRRSEGMSALIVCANAMERFYTQGFSYLGAGAVGINNTAGDANSAGAPTVCPASTNYYTIVIDMNSTATTYTLRATPISVQIGDGIIELDSTGAKRWDEDNDGFNVGDPDDNWILG